MLLDLATLSALLLTLTFVPVRGLRRERRISHAIRQAELRRSAEAGRSAARFTARPAHRTARPAPRTAAPSPCGARH